MDVNELVSKIAGELENDAYEASDALVRMGSEEVLEAMVGLLSHDNSETRFLAARTLGQLENNSEALQPMLEAIQSKENKSIAGDLLMTLEGYDLSLKYVEMFKHYLNGSFKVSMQAKDLLDHKEFDITSRVIRKAKKHWDHYANNVKQDELFELRKLEVDEMLNDLQAFIDE